MSIALENLRHLQGSRLTVENETVGNRSLSLFSRLKSVTSGGHLLYGTKADQSANQAFKAAFFSALVKAEGLHVASRAVMLADLPPNWMSSANPMSAGTCRQVMAKAEYLRTVAMRQTEKLAETFADGTPDTGARGVLDANGHVAGETDSLATMLHAIDARGPGEARTHVDADLKALFLQEVRRSAVFGTRPFTRADLTRIAHNAVTHYNERAAGRMTEAHPGLAAYHSAHLATTCRAETGLTVAAIAHDLVWGRAAGAGLRSESMPCREALAAGLQQATGNGKLLRETHYKPSQWQVQCLDLEGAIRDVQNAVAHLEQLAAPPTTPEGAALHTALIADLRHQETLLKGKLGFVHAMAEANPRSKAAIAYNDRLWVEAFGHIMRDAMALVPQDKVGSAGARRLAAEPATLSHNVGRNLERLVKADRGITDASMQMADMSDADRAALVRDAQADRSDTWANGLLGEMNRLQAESYKDRETIDDDRSFARPVAPEVAATGGKASMLDRTRRLLADAGLSEADIKGLLSETSVSAARRRALNENQDWAPIHREMVVQRNGVTRTYQSVISPARNISPRFARTYDKLLRDATGREIGTQPGGVSSATKNNHYHARNLKVSELHRPDRAHVTRVIGHGVLDMWDIGSRELRQEANERGAQEVLDAALATNGRVLGTALARHQNGDNTPVRLTHVSVNLVTPSPVRENVVTRPIAEFFTKDLTDYQELAYTREQFRAFDAVATPVEGAAAPLLRVADPGDAARDIDLPVTVDAITFSFAINPLATQYGSSIGFVGGRVTGGWSKVYGDNLKAMERFVGDLGSGERGSEGARPGGFIGSIYSRVDPSKPDQVAMAAQLRRQTNTVRSLFTSEAFRRGDGDPAKMGREILALQALAEEALSVMEIADQAATMSKGCKSDKDRGGVTDVELKHKIITEEMGGEIAPNAALGGDDQDNYYVVSATSGQFENQQLNTGLMGSKEAGHLKARIPDAEVRVFLKGMGEFTAE